jgi:hypothetical protein
MRVQQPCLNILLVIVKTAKKKWNLIPVAIRCAFNEYESLEDVKEDYPPIETLKDLQKYTTVVEIPDSDRLIIEAF